MCFSHKFSTSVAALLAALPLQVAISAPITGINYEIKPLYTVDGNSPSNFETPVGGKFDGVGKFISSSPDGSTTGCTASLLNRNRQYALTAAHCFTDDKGDIERDSGTVEFEGQNGSELITIKEFIPHPNWEGSFFQGNDIGLLELKSLPSSDIAGYGINTFSDPLQTPTEKVGYGLSGTGNSGVQSGTFGTKRDGQNSYDKYGDFIWGAMGVGSVVPQSQLHYDFDDGSSNQDAFDFFFNVKQQGVTDEVLAAPGDSGGPTFLNGTIAGIGSYGLRLESEDGTSSDIDTQLNSTYGEFGGDTNVARYAGFIERETGGVQAIPTPSTFFLIVGSALGLFFGHRRFT